MSGRSPCSRCVDEGSGSDVPLGSVLAQQGLEMGEVVAEVILVGARVSGRSWGGFKKGPRGVKG